MFTGEAELHRFQAFLQTLQADLYKTQELRDRVLAEIQAYEELEANVRLLQQASRGQGRAWCFPRGCIGFIRRSHAS